MRGRQACRAPSVRAWGLTWHERAARLPLLWRVVQQAVYELGHVWADVKGGGGGGRRRVQLRLRGGRHRDTHHGHATSCHTARCCWR